MPIWDHQLSLNEVPPVVSLPMLTFLPYDIIYEILSHLSTIDILRTRRACKWLAQMTFHRAVWSAAHERSRLLLAEGPIGNQTSSDLEAALVRATKLSLVWTAHPSRPPPTMSRCLQKSYPVFSFEAALVGGRYLLTVENRRLCLFDLDATQRDGLKSPLLARETYWERKLISTCGMLCYQTNTCHDVVHVAFTQRGVMYVRLSLQMTPTAKIISAVSLWKYNFRKTGPNPSLWPRSPLNLLSKCVFVMVSCSLPKTFSRHTILYDYIMSQLDEFTTCPFT